ncbi:MAG TPA: hypothetical protein VK969_06245, partial [Acidimicrobiia bacterium]|nr:hypothetical protein [Acidimicrobiia bacterium]
MQRSTVVRVAIFLATVVASWAVLSIGTGAEPSSLEEEEGRPSPETFFAEQAATVVDRAETERLQREARDAVPEPREVDTDIQDTVIADIQSVFEELESLAVGDPPENAPEIPELPEEEVTPTTEADDATQVPETSDPAVLNGRLFIDADGDGVFNPEVEEGRADRGLSGVDVEVRTHQETYNTTTNDDGVWQVEYPGGPAVVVVDHEDPDVPNGYVVSTENTGQLVDCDPEETCETADVGLRHNLRPVSEVVDSIDSAIPEEALARLAGVAADDVVRAALGEPLHLPAIQSAAVTRATVEFTSRIVPEDLADARSRVRSNPLQVIHADTGISPEDTAAAAEVVAANLQANYRVNRTLWEQQQNQAAAEVPAVEEEFDAGSLIVTEGERLTQLHIDAIEATSAPTIVE